MSYLGTEELKKRLPACISDYKESNIDNVAYELALGDEVYVTDAKKGKKEKLDAKNSQVVIHSGQFALLVTEEIVNIPTDILGFISIKFSQKIKGLINVSGFHVDPGFKGKIIFSVYNAGPGDIVLDKGGRYFMLWLSNLTGTSEPYKGEHKNQSGISAKNIGDLTGKIASPNALLKRIGQLESKINNFTVIASVVITIGVGLTLKSLFDAAKFNEGYFSGLRQQRTVQGVDSALINIDSIVSSRVNNALQNSNHDTTTANK